MENKTVEVLMSAMHQENFDIAYRSKVNSDLLIINQCDKDAYDEIEVDGHLWRMISTKERGLSKSRNMALKNAKGYYCLLCDDDEELAEGYTDIIKTAFEKLNNASAVVFNLNRINLKNKKKYYKIEKIRLAPSYKSYGSPMLCIKIEDIKNNSIEFNEHFGSGTQWGGGEDCLFERDIVKAKMKIYEYPETISTVDYSGGSNWFHGYTENYFYNSGAYVQYLYPRNIILRILREAYSCYCLRNIKEISSFKKMYLMYLGGKGIKKDVTYSEFMAGKQSNKSSK